MTNKEEGRYPDYDAIIEWLDAVESKQEPATDRALGKWPLAVSEPTFLGREREYVLDCIDRRWLTQGQYVGHLERGIQELTGRRFAIACNSGTSALHLAVLGMGIRPGDHVMVPALTYIATANAVSYAGGIPVFCDVDPESWTMDPADVDRKIKRLAMTGVKPVGCIPVHLYDAMADLDAIRQVMPSETWMVEDAAQAFGATYYVGPETHNFGTPAGAWGEVGTFSFYGSKTITAGEGGAVVTDNQVTADTIRLYRGQGADRSGRYEHSVIGYNYRMTDIGAAIACAQLEDIDQHLGRRRAIIREYHRQLGGIEGIKLQNNRGAQQSGAWAMAAILPPGCNRDEVAGTMFEAGVETRPFFVPLHRTGAYIAQHGKASCQIASHIAGRGLVLPTHAGMGHADIDRATSALRLAIQ